MRRRVLALTAALPSECLDLLEMDADTLASVRWTESAVSGIDETHSFTPSDVETELTLVWHRLRR